MATKTRRKTNPEPVSEPKKKEDSRRGLWVVTFGRMKQYGDLTIERPGQVIRKQHLINDEKLLKHGYVRKLTKHEDVRQCPVCGLTFLGSETSGPYKSHLGYARHDLAKLDLDIGTSTPDGRVSRADVEGDPDSAQGGEWDLERGDTPPVTKLEDEVPSREATVSLGGR